MELLYKLNELEPLLRMFWYVAIPTSLIFIIQSALTFLGADVADGVEVDFEGDLGHGDTPFQVFSFRNLINFLLGFSWTGISFYSTISNTALLLIFSLIIGVVFVYLFFVIIKNIQQLAEDNTFKLSSTINKTAEVYLAIPEKKSGKGKIMISINGSFHELEAITENEKIPSGALVRIIKIENNNLLVVETI